VNDEMEKMQKETVVDYFKKISSHLSEKTEENL
jgi:hypothetical protein